MNVCGVSVVLYVYCDRTNVCMLSVPSVIINVSADACSVCLSYFVVYIYVGRRVELSCSVGILARLGPAPRLPPRSVTPRGGPCGIRRSVGVVTRPSTPLSLRGARQDSKCQVMPEEGRG